VGGSRWRGAARGGRVALARGAVGRRVALACDAGWRAAPWRASRVGAGRRGWAESRWGEVAVRGGGTLPRPGRIDQSSQTRSPAGAESSGAAMGRRAMNRRRTHLWPGGHHPCALPAVTTMIERATVRVHDGGGGRRSRCRAVSLTQRDELQGRIHGPAHQLSERALVLAAIGHRREHVFARLWGGSDGKGPKVREPDRPICGSHGVEPNRGSPAASDLAAGFSRPIR
jgi:hypothetical protein